MRLHILGVGLKREKWEKREKVEKVNLCDVNDYSVANEILQDLALDQKQSTQRK